MLHEFPHAPQGAVPACAPGSLPTPTPRAFGVGIDVSRYGHYAAFLRDDLQAAADELTFAESALGYGQLRSRLELVARRHGNVRFVVRIDVAGQYADNLIHFLQRLAKSLPIAISCGDPQRNKNYRAAMFGSQKSDPIEARAAARFAVSEQPAAMTPLADELRRARPDPHLPPRTVRPRNREEERLRNG